MQTTLLQTRHLVMKGCRFTRRGITVVLFAASLCSALDARPAVWGRVQNEFHQELPGVMVIAQSLSSPQVQFSTKTDRAGNYSFEELPDGDFSLGATADGYIGTTYSPIRIRYPSRESRDFVLPLAVHETKANEINVRIFGTLFVEGRPLASSTVCVLREPVKRCVETNGIGQYFLTVEPGVYRAWVLSNERIVWVSSLEFLQAGSYRDPIRISQ